MIKVYARAIIPTKNAYVLMGDHDKSGAEVWDLPGGELKAGVDVKQHLREVVLANTGYSIVNLKFFEITCKVRPRSRGQDPATIIDFIFTSTIDPTERRDPAKAIELLRFEKFEWLESGGQFRENKVIGLLTRYHRHHLSDEEARLRMDMENTVC